MRIKIKFKGSNEKFEFNNNSLVNSYIHKCIGENNEYHDKKSNYSISSLHGGIVEEIDGKKYLSYINGAFIIVSSLDPKFINKILIGVFNNNIGKGLKFDTIEHIEEQFFNGWNYFITLSPFIIKKYNDKNNYKFLTLYDDNFEKEVESHIIKKLLKIDPSLNITNFKLKINKQNSKVKNIMIRNVKNKANQCLISIQTNKKIAETIYNIGIGQSTGAGFGSIYTTKNHKIYRNKKITKK